MANTRLFSLYSWQHLVISLAQVVGVIFKLRIPGVGAKARPGAILWLKSVVRRGPGKVWVLLDYLGRTSVRSLRCSLLRGPRS